MTKTGYVDKQGRRKDYSSAYLRRTYRDGGQVKNETVANLSALPDHVIDLIDAGLKGTAAGARRRARSPSPRSLPHGHVAAVARDGRQARACPRCSAPRAASGTWPWR